jgi:predicted transcriptional regulator
MAQLVEIESSFCIHSFNVKIMSRILNNLLNYGPLKTSNVAMHSRLNYNRCKTYLKFMHMLDLIELRNNENSSLVYITNHGKSTLPKFTIFN